MYWFDRLLDKSERYLGKYCVRHFALFLVGVNAVVFLFSGQWPEFPGWLAFNRDLIFQGQLWRLVTYIFIPPSSSPLFMFFALYLLYLFAGALEAHWGSYRFHCYYLIGMLGTSLIGLLLPQAYLTGAYINTSIFLAFAALYPDFQLYVFFVIPVKVKYLALLAWVGIVFGLLFGSWTEAVIALVSVANYLLFFWPVLRRNAVYTHRSIARPGPSPVFTRNRAEPFHRCARCGKTEQDDPSEQFRVCSCGQEFCREHLVQHDHPAA